MNTEKYHQILAMGFIFQCDNDPKHLVKACLDRKTYNGTLAVMDWSPQSLDLTD